MVCGLNWLFRALCSQETISLGNPAVFNCYYGKILNTYKSWNNCIMDPWVPLFSVTNYHNFSVMFHLFFIGVLLENPSYYIILPQILQCTFITIFSNHSATISSNKINNCFLQLHIRTISWSGCCLRFIVFTSGCEVLGFLAVKHWNLDHTATPPPGEISQLPYRTVKTVGLLSSNLSLCLLYFPLSWRWHPECSLRPVLVHSSLSLSPLRWHFPNSFNLCWLWLSSITWLAVAKTYSRRWFSNSIIPLDYLTFVYKAERSLMLKVTIRTWLVQ